MDAKTDESTGKCPVPHSRGRTNRDWWPNHLNIGVLHQSTPDADPMGKGFDYVKEFESLDLDAVIKDLRLDQAPVDPTTLTGDELVHEVQRVVKALLGYGARMPKELMLYVKNMVFLDGAIARLAPDLDILGEIANISMLFAERHGERLGAELGIDHRAIEINLDGVKAGFGLESSADTLTYRQLQQRRELIQKRMRDHVRPES